MKFELTPPNKQFSDNELIDDLRNVSDSAFLGYEIYRICKK